MEITIKSPSARIGNEPVFEKIFKKSFEIFVCFFYDTQLYKSVNKFKNVLLMRKNRNLKIIL